MQKPHKNYQGTSLQFQTLKNLIFGKDHSKTNAEEPPLEAIQMYETKNRVNHESIQIAMT